MPPLSILLNWRIWVGVALLASHGWAYHLGGLAKTVDFAKYVQARTDAALAAEREARAKEATLNQANQKVTEDYESLKTATATAVGALDSNRLQLLATIRTRNSGTPRSASACQCADATPQERVLTSCVTEYSSVAGDAEALSNQVTGLQAYVKTVVQPSKGP